MKTPPILLLAFNRPDLARQVFATIRAAQPSRLFIAVDGPRDGKPGEAESVAETRRLADEVDWPCEVSTRFLEENRGCKTAVSGAITWFFEHVEEGVILEEDCVPDPSFFPYCAAMLELYRNDERVAVVSGNNFLPPEEWRDEGHDFSLFPCIWGWASWRRAWRHYRSGLDGWPELKSRGWLHRLLGDGAAADHWAAMFDSCRYGWLDSWAFTWTYSCWRAGMLCAVPACNLVTNIGFDERGTHTTNADQWDARLPVRAINPVVRQAPVERNRARDTRYLTLVFRIGKRSWRLKWWKSVFRRLTDDVGAWARRTGLMLTRSRRARAKLALEALHATRGDGEVTLGKIRWRYSDGVAFASLYEETWIAKNHAFANVPRARRIVVYGGGDGVLPVYFERSHAHASILAIEPEPGRFESLKTNLARAGTSRVEAVHLPTASGTDAGDWTLRALVGEGHVDLLVIDAGARGWELFADGTGALRRVRRVLVRHVVESGRPQYFGRLVNELNEAGFRVHVRPKLASAQPFLWRPEADGVEQRVDVFAWRE